MAAKTTLNARNLETLGAARLAELLIEIATGSAAAKQRLRLELAAKSSPTDFVNEIRKRLTSLGRGSGLLYGPSLKRAVADLETQRKAIAERVANADDALALMWRLLALGTPLSVRCEGDASALFAVFQRAAEDMRGVALRAKPDPLRLADTLFLALKDDGTTLLEPLIDILAEPLGPAGITRLKQQFVAWSQAEDRSFGRQRRSIVRRALERISDLQGDVDGYMALLNDAEKKIPQNAALVARRLLAAGRTEEAWAAVEAADLKGSHYIPREWEMTRLDVMEALGRNADAQRFRWKYFQQSLDPAHLKAFLKRLPDFEDMEAEEKAMAYVAGHPNVMLALEFLVKWPNLDRAADLVRTRGRTLNGDHYEFLTPAAEALAGKHPLAATILLRTMIDFTLGTGRSSRYRHAARHLAECQSLAPMIADWGDVETHQDFMARILRDHPRKHAFWELAA